MRSRRRCRLHGGLSTGPRTPDGLARLRQAHTRHGRYAREQVELARRLRESRLDDITSAHTMRNPWMRALYLQVARSEMSPEGLAHLLELVRADIYRQDQQRLLSIGPRRC